MRQPSVLEKFFNLVESSPDQAAIEMDGIIWTYQELLRHAERWRSYYLEVGISSGDRVALSMSLCPEAIAALIGAVMLDLAPLILSKEMALNQKILGDFLPGAKWITDRDIRKLDAFINVDRFSFAKYEQKSRLAIQLCSSGSTGDFKIVQLSHQNIIYANSQSPMADYKNGARVLGFLPISTLAGFYGSFIMPFMNGGTLVIAVASDSLSLYKLIRDHSISAVLMVSSLVRSFKSISKIEPQSKNLLIWLGGEPVRTEDLQILHNIFPHAEVWICYAMTEACRISCLNLNQFPDKKESVGRPARGLFVKVKNRAKNQHYGEIWVKGSSVALGYGEAPLSVDSEGFFNTGDLGYLDEDGFLYLVGRKRDLIKYKGFSILAGRIEGQIRQVLQREVVVLGVPHEVYGEVAICFVEGKEFSLNGETIKAKFKDLLLPYEIPFEFVFIKKFPKTRSRKVEKKKLLDDYLKRKI